MTPYQVSVVIVAIGFVLGHDDPLGWSDTVLVTEESTISDFGLGQAEILLLDEILNLSVAETDHIYQIAEARLAQQKVGMIQ